MHAEGSERLKEVWRRPSNLLVLMRSGKGGPGRLQALQGAGSEASKNWSFLEKLWEALGGLWEALGAGRCLEGSWQALGGSCEFLGATVPEVLVPRRTPPDTWPFVWVLQEPWPSDLDRPAPSMSRGRPPLKVGGLCHVFGV